MALSTRKIADSIEWVKRETFGRNPVIGNSLEPALTSATNVLQTILAPPFEWWWNNQELVFTCNPTANAATSTSASVSGNILTVTATNTFALGNVIQIGTFSGALAGLSGQVLVLTSATSSSFTAAVSFANAGPDTTATIFTNVTTQDYTIPTPTFSHIEHASVRDLSGPTNIPGKWWELEIKNQLSLESSANRPMFISPHSEDGNGNMTFRVTAAPDKPYPVSVHVQLAAPPITSINQTWAPIPDFMSSVYDMGFLAEIYRFADDPRAAGQEAKFKAALIGRSEGLTEEEKNIFLNGMTSLNPGGLVKMQQGIQARAV